MAGEEGEVWWGRRCVPVPHHTLGYSHRTLQCVPDQFEPQTVGLQEVSGAGQSVSEGRKSSSTVLIIRTLALMHSYI